MDGQIAGAMRELGDVGAALGLGQDDALEIRGREQPEVRLQMLAPERVDAHPPVRAAGSRRQRLQDVTSRGLARRSDAVLEVEDYRVRVAGQRPRDLLLAVGGNEQPAARMNFHCGFFSSNAVRVHSQTSSPRWLKLRCAQVTMPALGRDLLS